MKKNQKKDEEEEEKKRRMRLRGELPKEEEEEDEDWDPEPILACEYLNDGSGRFIVTSQGPFVGYYYVCDFKQERPMQAVEIPRNTVCRFIDRSPSGQFLVLACDNGEVQIRNAERPEKSLQIKMHDAQQGRITSARFDKEERMMLTSGEDGLVYIHLVDRENVVKESGFDPLADVEGVDFMAEQNREELKQEKTRAFFEDNPPLFAELDRD